MIDFPQEASLLVHLVHIQSCSSEHYPYVKGNGAGAGTGGGGIQYFRLLVSICYRPMEKWRLTFDQSFLTLCLTSNEFFPRICLWKIEKRSLNSLLSPFLSKTQLTFEFFIKYTIHPPSSSSSLPLPPPSLFTENDGQ